MFREGESPIAGTAIDTVCLFFVPVVRSMKVSHSLPPASVREQGLVAMDNDDVRIVIIMNGVNCLMGSQKLCMAEFIRAKRRLLEQGAGQRDEGVAKVPRRTMTSD